MAVKLPWYPIEGTIIFLYDGKTRKGKKMKKRLFEAVLSAAICLTAPMAVMAEESTQNLTVNLTAEPSYTVTIPGIVTMGNDGTTVDVTAEDVKNLPEGKKISVTIAGTDKYRDQMVVEADTSPRTSLRYQIISETGETIETNAATGAVGVGKEVVSFVENGTKQYQIKPVINGRYEYGVDYTGSIIFGIEVVETN